MRGILAVAILVMSLGAGCGATVSTEIKPVPTEVSADVVVPVQNSEDVVPPPTQQQPVVDLKLDVKSNVATEVKPTETKPSEVKPSAPVVTTPTVKTFTKTEVAAHASKTDCFSIVRGNVYNLTSWIGQHPGGESAILSLCGKDGTAAFEGQHGGAAQQEKVLASFKVGVVAK